MPESFVTVEFPMGQEHQQERCVLLAYNPLQRGWTDGWTDDTICGLLQPFPAAKRKLLLTW